MYPKYECLAFFFFLLFARKFILRGSEIAIPFTEREITSLQRAFILAGVTVGSPFFISSTTTTTTNRIHEIRKLSKDMYLVRGIYMQNIYTTCTPSLAGF